MSDLKIEYLQFQSCNKGPIFIFSVSFMFKKRTFQAAFVLASQTLQSRYGLQV